MAALFILLSFHLSFAETVKVNKWMSSLQKLILMDVETFGCPPNMKTIKSGSVEKTVECHSETTTDKTIVLGNKQGLIVLIEHTQNIPSLTCNKDGLAQVFNLSPKDMYEASDTKLASTNNDKSYEVIVSGKLIGYGSSEFKCKLGSNDYVEEVKGFVDFGKHVQSLKILKVSGISYLEKLKSVKMGMSLVAASKIQDCDFVGATLDASSSNMKEDTLAFNCLFSKDPFQLALNFKSEKLVEINAFFPVKKERPNNFYETFRKDTILQDSLVRDSKFKKDIYTSKLKTSLSKKNKIISYISPVESNKRLTETLPRDVSKFHLYEFFLKKLKSDGFKEPQLGPYHWSDEKSGMGGFVLFNTDDIILNVKSN